jgi:PadR family transcriptional regulator, regulatory protein AphA
MRDLSASPQLPTTSYAILGIISREPASGYEVAMFAASAVAQMWPIAKSQVYGELARLEKLGHIHGVDVAQDKWPDKRVYTLTESGNRALDLWLTEPTHGSERTKNSFLLKVFFAHRMPPESLEALIRGHLSAAEEHRDRLSALVDRLDMQDISVYGRATALFGLYLREADIAWAKEILASLPAMRARFAATTETESEV